MKYVIIFLLVFLPFSVGANYSHSDSHIYELIYRNIQKEIDKPETPNIYHYVTKYCKKYNVPYELVHSIGMNESGFRNPNDLNYIIQCRIPGEDSRGDLQINNPTDLAEFKHSRITRIKLLEVGIKYLKHCYDISGSWKKARYIYARGSWKSPSKWSKLENRFMSKIDWTKYMTVTGYDNKGVDYVTSKYSKRTLKTLQHNLKYEFNIQIRLIK